jgi:hypothetical protein
MASEVYPFQHEVPGTHVYHMYIKRMFLGTKSGGNIENLDTNNKM